MSAKKKIACGLICAAVTLSSNFAMAQWEPAGYDTTNPPQYGKIYNEVINGNYTNNIKLDILPDSAIKWKPEGYELAYPHAGFSRLYLEGNAQVITRFNNSFPQFETRFVDAYWELSGNHTIWQRQQTKMPKQGWVFDYGNPQFNIPDGEVFVPTTRHAETVDYYKAYGVANVDMNGKYISEAQESLYDICGIDVIKCEQAFWDDFFTPSNLSQKYYDNGHYVITDDMIANKLVELNAVIASKYVVGPSFNGTKETLTKNVASMYKAKYDEGTANEWNWDANSVAVDKAAQIGWTEPLYEMAEPYHYYQCLIVNGLVLDGHNDTPKVWRYTGGNAQPKVEWKYEKSLTTSAYDTIEQKYVDGVATGEYRVPTGKYANCHIVVTPNEIQFYVKDNNQDVLVDRKYRTEADYGDYASSYVPGTGYGMNN